MVRRTTPPKRINHAATGLLTLHLLIPGCTSLKEKRSRLKPLISRLHHEFNVSAAEVGLCDAWQEALVSCAVVSNEGSFNQKMLQNIVHWVSLNWPDLTVLDQEIEALS